MTNLSRSLRRVPRLDLLALAIFAITLVLTILPWASPSGGPCPGIPGIDCVGIGVMPPG